MFNKVLTAAALAIALAAPSGVIAATVKQGATRVDDSFNIVPSDPGGSIARSNANYDNSATTPSSDWVWVGDAFTTTAATYTFEFDLTGFDASTAALSGLWGVDNNGTISLNGNQIAELSGTVVSSFDSLNTYGTSDPVFFNTGLNTLTFDLVDDGGPAAFRATATVEATVIPLPAAGVLLLLGIGGLAGVRRLRQA